MTLTLALLLSTCPTSAEATEALQRESWGSGLTVAVEGVPGAPLDVSLSRDGRLLRGGQLPLASTDCASRLRAVVLAMHAWTRAIKLEPAGEAPAPAIDVREEPVVRAEPVPVRPAQRLAAPPLPAPKAREPLADEPEPLREPPAVAEPVESPVEPAPVATPTTISAPPEPATATSPVGIALSLLAGLSAPNPTAALTARCGFGFGRWGLDAGARFQSQYFLGAANTVAWSMSLRGRVRFPLFASSALDLAMGGRLDFHTQTPGFRLIAPAIAVTAGLEWRQQLVAPVALVTSLEGEVREFFAGFGSQSGVGVFFPRAAVFLMVGVEAKVL